MVGVICTLLLITLLNRIQNQIIKTIDENTITPSDYTIYIQNLPVLRDGSAIIAFFKEKLPDLKIAKVNLVYNVGELIESIRKREQWRMKKISLGRFRQIEKLKRKNKGVPEISDDVNEMYPMPTVFCCCFKSNNKYLSLASYPSEIEIDKAIDFYEKKVDVLYKEQISSGNKNTYTGKAFVTFQLENGRDYL